MHERERTLLRDMLDAARKAQSFAQGKTRETLDQDDLLAFALVRALEIVDRRRSSQPHQPTDTADLA